MQILRVFLFMVPFCASQVQAQSEREIMDSLIEEIEFLIGDDWYLEQSKNGFQVTFCRSCNEKYKAYLETTDYFDRELVRDDFFEAHLIDSVSYFSTVSHGVIPSYWSENQKKKYYSDLYKPDAILRFDIEIEKEWSQKKVETTLQRNNQLRDSILLEPLFKSNTDIFSDYRFWLPIKYWQRRTEDLDFYFERLPYASVIINKSILIDHNKPFFFSEPMLVDREDPEYFYKEENRIENERRRTLKVIALVLGIHDYVIVN